MNGHSPSDPTTRLTLEERVERLEIRNQITHLETLYCRYWDESNAEAWANVFTDDGQFTRTDLPGRSGHTQRGRDELTRFCRELQADYGRFHILGHLDIAVHSPDRATSRISFGCLSMGLGRYPRPGYVIGYYDTEYVRSDGTESGFLITLRRERQVMFSETRHYGVENDQKERP